jgi:hypothetical protein
MSFQTRKKNKEKKRLKAQEKARGPLVFLLDIYPALLDLNPKQLISCIRVCRRLPIIRSQETARIVINMIRAETDFTYDNVKKRINGIVTSSAVEKSSTNFFVYSDTSADQRNTLAEEFVWCPPNELLEFVELCHMTPDEWYATSLSGIWKDHNAIDIGSLRYEDIDMIVNMARIKRVMET